MSKKTNNDRWMIFIKDQNSKSQLQEYISNGLIKGEIIEGSMHEAIEYAKNNKISLHVIIELTSTENAEHDIKLLSEHCANETRLICLGSANDINFYRKLISLGVDDYLTIPLDVKLLAESINKVSQTSNIDNEDISSNSIISVVNTRGGLGGSTIASNIAWLIANNLSAKTCLIDLDIQCGTSSLMFNKDPNQGLSQALANSSRLDQVFLQRLVIKASENLVLLASEQGIGNNLYITDEDLQNLTRLVSSIYEYTIADINHNNPYTEVMMSLSTDIYLVVDFSISSIRDAAKLIKSIGIKAPFAKVKLLAIKNNLAKGAEITQAQFEDALERQIDFIIPFDRKATLESLNLGKILAEQTPNNPIVIELNKAISSSTQSTTMKPKEGFFERLKNWRI